MAEKSLTQINREIAETELETKQLQLAEAKERNQKYVAAETARRKGNAQRQAELKQTAAGERSIQKRCRHKSGGSPNNIAKGGGKFAFSLLTRTIMPDGKTEFIQCQRCGLKLYGRDLTPFELSKLQHADPQKYDDYLWWQKLRDISIEDGIPDSEMRGPTFVFQNADGVNFIPDRV